MLLGSGALEGVRVLSAGAMAKMLRSARRARRDSSLGWDTRSAYSNNRGTSLSRRAVGHGGYTGTSLWVDPEQNLFVIFLSNRVHPDGKGSIRRPGRRDCNAGWVDPRARGERAAVCRRPLVVGIDTLVAEKFAPLRGLRFALLTNDSARARDGSRTTDVLAAHRDLKLVALLAPSMVYRPATTEFVDDGIDAKTKLPVFSLMAIACPAQQGSDRRAASHAAA